MTQLTKMRIGDRVADVHPDEVENFKAAGFVVDDDGGDELTEEKLVELLVTHFHETAPEKLPKVGETEDATGLDVTGKLIKSAFERYESEFAQIQERVDVLAAAFADADLEAMPAVEEAAAYGINPEEDAESLITVAWEQYRVDLDAKTLTGDGTGEALPEESNLNSDVDLPDAGDESSEVGTSEVVDEQAEQSGESSESLTDDQLVDLLVNYFRGTELESKPGVGDTETATGLDVNGKLITRAWQIYTAEAAE